MGGELLSPWLSTYFMTRDPYTLKNLAEEICFNSKISLLNSEKWATNLLMEDHFPLFRSEFSLLKQFLLLISLACNSVGVAVMLTKQGMLEGEGWFVIGSL